MGYSRQRDSDTFELTNTDNDLIGHRVRIEGAESGSDVESRGDLAKGTINVRHEVIVDR